MYNRQFNFPISESKLVVFFIKSVLVIIPYELKV